MKKKFKKEKQMKIIRLLALLMVSFLQAADRADAAGNNDKPSTQEQLTAWFAQRCTLNAGQVFDRFGEDVVVKGQRVSRQEALKALVAKPACSSKDSNSSRFDN